MAGWLWALHNKNDHGGAVGRIQMSPRSWIYVFCHSCFHDELQGATESERERRRSIKDGKSFSIFSLEHFALNYLIIYYAAEGGWREREGFVLVVFGRAYYWVITFSVPSTSSGVAVLVNASPAWQQSASVQPGQTEDILITKSESLLQRGYLRLSYTFSGVGLQQ